MHLPEESREIFSELLISFPLFDRIQFILNALLVSLDSDHTYSHAHDLACSHSLLSTLLLRLSNLWRVLDRVNPPLPPSLGLASRVFGPLTLAAHATFYLASSRQPPFPFHLIPCPLPRSGTGPAGSLRAGGVASTYAATSVTLLRHVPPLRWNRAVGLIPCLPSSTPPHLPPRRSFGCARCGRRNHRDFFTSIACAIPHYLSAWSHPLHTAPNLYLLLLLYLERLVVVTMIGTDISCCIVRDNKH